MQLDNQTSEIQKANADLGLVQDGSYLGGASLSLPDLIVKPVFSFARPKLVLQGQICILKFTSMHVLYRFRAL
jgi:hypothetical protein